jgi:hypothetical protein
MPTPQTSSSSSFPSFPDHIICGLAKEFVDLYTPIREVPPQFLWLAFITYLGNSISRFVRLNIDYSEPRLFGVAIGRSARTKKSTGNNLARDFFRRIHGNNQHVVEGFGSAEGLLTDLANHAGVPTLIHLDEINILAQKTSIDGSVGISALHKLFEDHDYDHTLAQNKGYKVRDAHLSLLGASTLDDFWKTWKGRHADAGFFSRLFLVGAERSEKRIPRPIPADAAKRQALVDRTKDLLARLEAGYKANNGTSVEYPLDAEAEAVWDRFYDSFGEGKEWDRIDTYGFRLMVILTVLKGNQTITEAVANHVVELLKYQVEVRHIVQPVIADNAVAEMEQLILRSLPTSGQAISRRTLYRKTHADRKGLSVFNRAIENLSLDGQITSPTTQTTKGKNSISYARVPDADDDTEAVTEKLVTTEVVDKSDVATAEGLVSPVTATSHAHEIGMQPGA